MRVLLIYPGRLLYGEQPLGILYLSSALKHAGHETKIWVPHLYDYFKRKLTFSRSSLIKEIEQFNPNLIGFSIDSTTFFFALEIAKIVKEHTRVPIIFGGPHTTVDPENTLKYPLVDMICVGEGEEALVELVSRMEEDSDITDIANIWCKSNDQIFINPIRPLRQDLDSLPLPDRDAFPIKVYSKQGLNVITSRGCPYHCSYCIEDYWHHLYSEKGDRVRFRDIKNVISELKVVIKNYTPRLIIFSDETFTLNRNRCIEFCHYYEKEIGIPFLCQTRANTVNYETLDALKRAGCISVGIGIEAGNDHIRNDILERGLSRETMINAFAMAKKIGLSTNSFNLIGAPFETEETIWDTINLNREIKPDQIQINILMPLKGTKVRALFEKNGWLSDEEKMGDFNLTVLQRLPTISKYRLLSYATFFKAYVKSDKRNHFLLNMLRRGFEFFLRLLPVNHFSQRVLQLGTLFILKTLFLRHRGVTDSSEHILRIMKKDFANLRVALAGSWPPPFAGFATQTMMLHKHLINEGARVYKLEDFRVRDLWVLPKILVEFFINISKCDVVHILLSGYRSFYRACISIIFAKILQKKVIIMIEGGFEAFLRSYHRFLAVQILRLVNGICIYTPFQEKIFKRHNLKIVNIGDFTPDFFRFNKRSSLKPVLLMNKLLEPYANHKCGVQAFKIIKNRFPDATLIITSIGSLEEMLKSLVKKLQLNDVRFIGQIEYEEMPEIYAEANILLHPTNRDVFPRTILESFASGTAVVATRIGGIPYMINDGENGLLTEPDNPEEMAEKVIYLLENPHKYQYIIRNARRIAEEKYSWTAYRKELAKLYGISM